MFKLLDLSNRKDGEKVKKTFIKFKNIEAERARNGFSVTSLSNQLGISDKTYRNWQAPNGDIPASKLLEMSKLFDCSIDYLLGIQQPPTQTT